MTKKRKRKSLKYIGNPMLLFWIIASLLAGTIIGYEFANNPDSKLLRELGIHSVSVKTDSVLPKNIDLCFTPPSGCAAVIVEAISKAKESIYVQAYGITSPPIVEALIGAQNRGIKVRMLLDKSNLKDKWSKMANLLEANIDVSIDNVSGIAHNKVMVLDEHIVITGSFNFTRAADSRNAENVIIIDDSVVAKQYLQNWFSRKVKNQSRSKTKSNKKHRNTNR